MRFLRLLARGFTKAFGITQPTPQQETQAAIFIGVLLGGVIVLIALMAVFVLR